MGCCGCGSFWTVAAGVAVESAALIDWHVAVCPNPFGSGRVMSLTVTDPWSLSPVATAAVLGSSPPLALLLVSRQEADNPLGNAEDVPVLIGGLVPLLVFFS